MTDTKRCLINVGISALVGPYDDQYGMLLAAATLGSVPLLLVFLIFQQQRSSGITSGTIKGA